MEKSSVIDEIFFMSQYFVALFHTYPPMRLRISKKFYLKTFSDLKARAHSEAGKQIDFSRWQVLV